MEAGMKTGLVILLGVVGLMAQPALAQAPVGGTNTSVSSLLAAGYEIKTILDISNDEQKAIWPNDTAAPYLLITLQRANSVAVCEIAMTSWVTLDGAALA